MVKIFEIKQEDAQALMNYITSQSVPKVAFCEVMLLVQMLQSLKVIGEPAKEPSEKPGKVEDDMREEVEPE